MVIGSFEIMGHLLLKYLAKSKKAPQLAKKSFPLSLCHTALKIGARWRNMQLVTSENGASILDQRSVQRAGGGTSNLLVKR